MNKKIILILAILCQFLISAKDVNKNTIYIDAAVSGLKIPSLPLKSSEYHLFSHGKSGELFIDNQWLNAAQISTQFKNELKGKKELYIYGCNFGEGEKGRQAVQYLEDHLDINVNASTNITGKNGDWKLEIGNGKNGLKIKHFSGNLQLANEHYLNPLLAGAYNANTITEEFIYLSTPSTSDIKVQMNYASGIGSPRISITPINGGAVTYTNSGEITINKTTPVRLQFVGPANTNAVLPPGTTPTTIATNKGGTVISGSTAGLKFTSTSGFFVNYRARSINQAGSMLTKGGVALGTEFRWGGSPVEAATTIVETGNMLSIMATEDATSVTISNIKTGTKFINGTNPTLLTGTSITQILQKGESFILYAPVEINNATSPQNKGWLGAKVASTKSIAVAVGGIMQQGGTPNNNNFIENRDIGFDQLVPTNRLGLEHIIMAGNGGIEEKVIVIATANDTKVYINDNTITPFATLASAGDYVLIPSTAFNAQKNMYVRVSLPSYVFQKIYGGTLGNTNSLMFLPPLSCFGQKEVDFVPDASKIGNTPYPGTQVVVLAGREDKFKPKVFENGIQLPNPVGGDVTGNPNWLSYRYTLTQPTPGNLTPTSNISITSEGTIFAEIFGANVNAGFGGYYSGFSDVPIYSISISNPGIGYICAGKGTMTVTAGVGTYQWFRNSMPITGAISNSYTLDPINDAGPASYYVVVTLAGGCKIISNQIESDICPCTKPATAGPPNAYTKMGISIRDKRTTANWPKDIPNGFIAMEANNKGFVITRIASPENDIVAPILGMLVYDTAQDCLKLYNGTSWNCIKPTCN